MVVFTVIFGRVAGLPSDGTAPYPLMVYAGVLPWTLPIAAVGGMGHADDRGKLGVTDRRAGSRFCRRALKEGPLARPFRETEYPQALDRYQDPLLKARASPFRQRVETQRLCRYQVNLTRHWITSFQISWTRLEYRTKQRRW